MRSWNGSSTLSFFCLMKERQVASTVDLPVRFQNEKSMDDVIIISW